MPRARSVMCCKGTLGLVFVAVVLAACQLTASQSPLPFNIHDLVVALPTDSTRMVLIEASRTWRNGIRTLIATNATAAECERLTREHQGPHNETYVHVDDEQPDTPNTEKRAKRPGDIRAALAPFLAAELFSQGSLPQGQRVPVTGFKWLLYGDDDTLWYMHGVAKLLLPLDHMAPMALTDNLWLSQMHPHSQAPRCLPCTLGGKPYPELPQLVKQSQLSLSNVSAVGAALKAGRRLLQHFGSTDVVPTGFRPARACPSCSLEASCTYYRLIRRECKQGGAHGGAGIVFSHALVGPGGPLTLGRALELLNQTHGASGGDQLVTWWLQRADVGFTDPGYSVRLNLTHRFQATVVFDNKHAKNILLAPSELLLSGRCNLDCKWLLRHAVSYHVGARFQPSIQHAAATLHVLSASYKLAHEYLAFTNRFRATQRQRPANG